MCSIQNMLYSIRKQLCLQQACFSKNSLKFVVVFTLFLFRIGSGLFNDVFETLIDRMVYAIIIQRSYHATVGIAENFAVVGILVFHFGFDLEIIWHGIDRQIVTIFWLYT